MSEGIEVEARAAQVLARFERIHREQMAGLPLLNERLTVAVTGFRRHEGRVCGVIITPWMMSLLLFPGKGDNWHNLGLGSKQSIALPGGAYRFMHNVIEGLGPLLMCSVHSPMHAFPNQESALAEAELFLERAFTPAAPNETTALEDEALLGRILRGEQIPELERALAEPPAAESAAAARQGERSSAKLG